MLEEDNRGFFRCAWRKQMKNSEDIPIISVNFESFSFKALIFGQLLEGQLPIIVWIGSQPFLVEVQSIILVKLGYILLILLLFEVIVEILRLCGFIASLDQILKV